MSKSEISKVIFHCPNHRCKKRLNNNNRPIPFITFINKRKSHSNLFYNTRAFQPVATCRQSPYLHKPDVILIKTSFASLAPTALAAPVLIMTFILSVTSFATEMATPRVTDVRYVLTYGHLTAFNI